MTRAFIATVTVDEAPQSFVESKPPAVSASHIQLVLQTGVFPIRRAALKLYFSIFFNGPDK
jgi:hypothetical protein